MFRLERVEPASFRADYAKRADFCELFEREMKPLYLLAFLLTANHQDSETCFAAAVDEALEEPVVFKEWAESWVKRSLVRNAIGIVSPASTRSGDRRDLWNRGQEEAPGDNEIDAVTQLAPLERFVFVMSILERYSIWDCSVLLGCSMTKVIQARMRALRRRSNLEARFPEVEAPGSHSVAVACPRLQRQGSLGTIVSELR
jgi:DNA-directed RNA polymerase specialized sigma24 family protein